jgi:predicted DNA-binding protein (MmcQ/YjbR family)
MPKHHDPVIVALRELREFGLAYPGAHIKSPWPGHGDLAVNDKTFAYLSVEGEPFGISCKLPHSCSHALALPNTKPTEYGLGKSGWVSARVPEGEAVPVEMFKEWIDESYRAQAPKRLVATLGEPRAAHASGSKGSAKGATKVIALPEGVRKIPTKKATKKTATKKTATKKTAKK